MMIVINRWEMMTHEKRKLKNVKLELDEVKCLKKLVKNELDRLKEGDSEYKMLIDILTKLTLA